MNNAITQTIEVGGKTLHLETGRLAKQASGAVVVRLGDTMVLTTVVVDDNVREGQSFFPLTVDYREKYAAGGKFPGGFMKREGRPTDKEVLSSRLIDRTIRPLFPDGFINEVQIIAGVYSADAEVDADMLGGIGASAALATTGAPFDGPTAHVRVGRVDGEFVLFPSKTEREASDFDLVVAGKEDALVMVEGEMKEVSEDAMMDAFDFAHDAIKTIIAGIKELRAKYVADRGEIAPMEYTTTAPADALVEDVHDRVKGAVEAHLRKPYAKESFYGGIKDIRTALLNDLFEVDQETGVAGVELYQDQYDQSEVKKAFSKAESQVMREMILDEGRRLDGRAADEVRPIWSEVSYLPKTHGSAIFTRGETQSLVMVTLGTGRDVQGVDQLFDQEDKRFYLHYNFPPFSTGEAKFLRGPGRREIGHGLLAERALVPLLPSEEEFPYTIRIVSDILESNGSSSMASVCGGSLALMDAGVPLRKPVAGIAMGLIKDGERVAVLSDILGTEDHLGDMDFKLTGTADGITACQMDIKIDGLQRSTMATALDQAKRGRDHILAEMAKTLDTPREDLAPSAPRLFQLVVDAEFIGEIIGPGGKMIRGIQADTGTKIDIEEADGKGYVTIAAEEGPGAEKAIEIIKGIVSVPEVGDRYDAKVINMLPFGAILELMPGKEALLHVSEMAHGYVDKPEDIVQVGDRIEVELIEIRDGGKLRVSHKPFLGEPSEEEKAKMRERRESRNNGGGGGGRRGGGRRGGGRRNRD